MTDLAPDGHSFDASTDPDASEGCIDWDATLAEPCDPALPAPVPLALALAGQNTLNTDTGMLSPAQGGARLLPSLLRAQEGGPMVRVVNLASLEVPSGASIRITGAHALLLVVHGNATVDGVLSVSSPGGASPIPGPGAADAPCGGAGIGKNGVMTASLTAAAGGAGGGGFGGDGGDGSDGEGSGAATKGGRGSNNGAAPLVPLRGGCRGGRGGDTGVGGDQGGAPGRGGGGVGVTVRGALTIRGTIEANGSGGRGGLLARGGGGGGGSGGGIFLEAGTIAVAGATLCAHGGGGGEGGDGGIGASTGGPGGDGTCTATPATGGDSADSTGGPGGSGGATYANAEDASAAVDTGGGGGGGGGVGRIRLRGIGAPPDPAQAALISPAPVLE